MTDSTSLKEVRASLKMTSKKLAEKAGKSSSTLSELEAREKTGNVTINSLKEIADSVGFDIEYKYVPRSPIRDLLLEQAKRQVLEELDDSEQYEDDDINNDAINLILSNQYLKWQ